MATKPTNVLLQHVRKLLTAQEIEQLTDRELLQRFVKERDEAAFAVLVRRHGPMILHACQRVLRNWHDAEDAFQATFMVLARKAGSRKWKESVGTWLYLVAYRLALKMQASRERPLLLGTRPVEHSSEDPLTAASDREVSGLLDEELSQLPEKCRAPLVLCSLEGFTRDQAARHLGWSLGTFRRRLEQGRALLRQRLERRGLPVSAILAAVLGTEEATRATVPLALTQSVVQMGIHTALGKAAPGVIVSSRAAVLAQGVLKGMWVFKAKVVLVAVLVLGIAGAGAGLALQRGATANPAGHTQPEPRQLAAQAKAELEPEQQQTAEWAGHLTITGRVLMPGGSPAAGALVSSLFGNDELATIVRTNAQGQFRLTGHFGQNCRLHAYSADRSYQTTFHVSEFLARNRSAIPVEMRLTPAREHVVTVTAENVPVEGAQVAATGFYYKVQGVTGKDGKVKLRVPSEDSLTALVAWHPRFGAAGFREIDHGIMTDATKLALLATAPHTIRVTDEKGRAVPNVRLTASFRTDAPNWVLTGQIGAAQLCTDAGGKVTCPWSPRQSKGADVRIAECDAADWKVNEIDWSKNADGLTILHVQRRVAVKGQLVLPQGISGEGLLVAGRGGGLGNHGDYVTARASRDGSFTLRVAPDHGYKLGVADRDWASDAWTGVILTEEKAEPVPIKLNVYPAIPLTVHVTRGPQRQPVAQVWIDLSRETELTFRHSDGTKQSAAAGGESTWLRTNSNGVASAGLGRGKYRVRLSAEDWQEERTVQVTTQKAVSVDFDKPWLDKRRIAGRLLRDNTPHKASKATTIQAWPSQDENGRMRPVRAEDLSKPVVSPDGRFEIAIDARDVSVLAIDPEQHLSGFAHLSQPDSVANLALAPTAIYRGVLVDAKGQPTAGKTLRLVVADSDVVAEQDRITNPQGQFQFEHVPGNVPLQLLIRVPDGRWNGFVPLGKRFFLSGEKREHTIVRLAAPDFSKASSDASKPPPNWLKSRLANLTRDARLNRMRVLVILQGDESKNVADTVRQLLDYEGNDAILCYLPLVISPLQFESDAATITQLGWQRPQTGEIVLLAIDGNGGQVGTQRLAVASVESSVQAGKAFLKQHAPPACDAGVLLKEAQNEAKKTGRRVWIIFCGPRCGPCFRLARWMEERHALLAKDYVVLKLMGSVAKGAWEMSNQLKRPANAGIPWMAVTEPDGTVLVTSDGPLGNVGFPTSLEDLRHLREMLARTAQRLTAEEQERILQSLSQRDE